jgi:hypothetical protein
VDVDDVAGTIPAFARVKEVVVDVDWAPVFCRLDEVESCRRESARIGWFAAGTSDLALVPTITAVLGKAI